jgi:hypothetical protein
LNGRFSELCGFECRRNLRKSAAGAECLEPDKNIWRQEFPHQADEYEERE